jgi:hypothetical protein
MPTPKNALASIKKLAMKITQSFIPMINYLAAIQLCNG